MLKRKLSLLSGWPLAAILCGLLVHSAGLSAQELRYQADLKAAPVGTLPPDFMAVSGEFTVKEADGKRFIELPGAPLDTFQLLFGPVQPGGAVASARCWGAKKGRQFPTFAVGQGGQAGYRLQVSPAKEQLELFCGEAAVLSRPFTWPSEQWTTLKLEVVRSGDGEWTVRGKAWTEGAAEPAEWLISTVTKVEPVKGRASVWGSPFSGQPIRYEQLKVEPVK
jgi:hypothetical protein